MSNPSGSTGRRAEGYTQVLVAGAVLGALIGALAAYLLWQQAREQAPAARRAPIDARQGVRLAFIVLKALRQIAALAG